MISISIIFIVQLWNMAACIDREDCGSKYGCWFVPPGCNGTSCTSLVSWSIQNNSVDLHIEGTLHEMLSSKRGGYVSLGLSLDERMGEDTVFDCVSNGRGQVRPFISYSDGLHNAQLHEVSELLITEKSHSVVDGFLSCEYTVHFGRRSQLSEEDRSKVFDLHADKYYLQLARGYADPYTFAKKKHSLLDGSLYPWTTKNALLLRSVDGVYDVINDARQSVTILSRSKTYLFVTFHSLLMLWAWWFFASNSIIIARYFKGIWPKTYIFSKAPWFKIHRNSLVISVVMQTLAMILIFTQSGFQFYFSCTLQCTMEHFSKPTHAWTGLIAFSIALFQPFFAWNRPTGISLHRKLFNWAHWVLGIAAFVIASVAMISAIPLGKTALARYYRKLPNLLMCLYLVIFASTSMILELMATLAASDTDKSDSAKTELMSTGERTKEDSVPKSRVSLIRRIRFWMLLVHVSSSFIICAVLSQMIISNNARTQ